MNTVPGLLPVGDAVSRPRVSIVMPTHKRRAIVGRTLATVAAQRFRDFEVLIRSDGPDDGTRDVVEAVGDRRFHFSESPQKLGMPGVLNALIQESRGEFVLVLHDHDEFDASLVGRMVEALERYPSALFVHTALEQVDESGRLVQRFVGDYPLVSTGASWLRYMLTRFDCPVCAMSMVRRSTYEGHGLYDPDYGFIADVEMWMRLAAHGDVAYIPDVLMSCRVREPGHEYRDVSWPLTETLLTIHRRYRRVAGLTSRWRRMHFECRAEAFRLIQLVAAMKGTRGSRASRVAASRHLRSNGGPLSRVLARVLA